MDYKISFIERAKIAKELLLKQSPVSLEQARLQVKWLKSISINNVKKQTK